MTAAWRSPRWHYPVGGLAYDAEEDDDDGSQHEHQELVRRDDGSMAPAVAETGAETEEAYIPPEEEIVETDPEFIGEEDDTDTNLAEARAADLAELNKAEGAPPPLAADSKLGWLVRFMRGQS